MNPGMPATTEASRRVLLDVIGPAPDLTVVTGYGNIGDQLIWAGTRQLLAGHIYREIPVEKIGEVGGDTVLLPGGGAWSRHFHEYMPTLLAIAESRFRRVIVMPSSYDVGDDVVAQALRGSRALFFAREEESLRRIRGLCNAAAAHDCALFFDVEPYRRQGSGVLHAMREDRESAGLVLLPVDNDDISTTADSLDDWLGAIAAHADVVTDRAHVMIAAAMLGKRVRYVPSGYHKVAALARTLPPEADVAPLSLRDPAPSIEVTPSPLRSVIAATLPSDPPMVPAGPEGPRVCAVVLSHNRPDMLARCVASLRESGAGVRTHVVDNNSDERTRRLLSQLLADPVAGKDITVHLADRNLGCAGGRSLGVAQVHEEFVLFLDDDAELLPGALAHLVADLDAHPHAQAVTAQVVMPDGRITHSGGSFVVSDDFVTFTTDGSGLRWDDPQVPPTGRCDWVGGTAVLIRTSALTVCPIDPSMASYYEDNDWALRMHDAFCDPFRRCADALAIHHFGPRRNSAGFLAHSRFLADRFATMATFLHRHGRLLDSTSTELADALAGTGLAEDPAAHRLLVRYAAAVAPEQFAAEWAAGDMATVRERIRHQHRALHQAQATVATLTGERDEALAQRDAVRHQHDEAVRQRDAVTVQRDQAIDQRDQARRHGNEAMAMLRSITNGGWWRLRGRIHAVAHGMDKVRRGSRP